MNKSFLPTLLVLLLVSCREQKDDSYSEWTAYGGTKETIRYSSLAEIDTGNVHTLQVAWEYHTGDADTANSSQIQCNPLIVDGVLYGTSPQMKLFAIDASTGKEKWVFNPFDSVQGNKRMFFILNNCRGISYWSDGKEDSRIFYTAGSDVFAINASTGRPVSSFGNNGKIDLHNGLGRDVSELFITATSPGMVYKDLLIMGSRVDEGAAAAPGHIRAYDVKTGKQQWIFHTIPHPGEPGFETWEDSIAYKKIGGANSWAGFSLDEKRGILFAPTGSASYDFYGGRRRGDNLYANSLLALDAATGKRLWHFQFVHHDLWDWDTPTPPVLVTVERDGKKIDAVAQTTKTGFVYVFERTTGEPLYEIREHAVDSVSEISGEYVSRTQPIPVMPKPFVRQVFTESEINDLLPDTSQEQIRRRLRSYKNGRMFIPPSRQGSVVFPGLDGGGEWGGPAYDPTSSVLYVNANEMAWVITIIDNVKKQPKNETYHQAGLRIYQQNCMSCHGAEREGTGNNPSLANIKQRYNRENFLELVNSGRRMMPSFRHLSDNEKNALASFVLEEKEQGKPFPVQPVDSFLTLPYTITGYHRFLSTEGKAAIRPPWGTLNAIDLNSGELLWKIPLGEAAEYKQQGLITGVENYGGPVVTAGGIIFIAATVDGKFRAIHKSTGIILWEKELPAPGFATPAVYKINGKQYVVIACGGGKLNTRSGDSYVAFALPATK